MRKYETPINITTYKQRVRSYLGWLLLSLISLAVSCICFGSVNFLILQVFGSNIYNGRSRSFELLSFVPGSIIAGIIFAIIVGIYWEQPLHVAKSSWILINVLGMVLGIWTTLLAYDLMGRYGYPVILWIMITAIIGGTFGSIQWLFIRQRTHSAGWWIPAMVSSWTLLWLLWYLWILILAD